jgi:cysteine-rich repeat protein
MSQGAKCLLAVAAWVLICAATASAGGDPCIVEDNGTGTVTLPPQGCEYRSPHEVFMLIDGLPPGTTIELDPIHSDFVCLQSPSPFCSLPLPPGRCETQGGSLGGDGHCYESLLELQVVGTGSLAGFYRTLWVPVSGEVHTDPRNSGDPVETFASEVYRLQGELFGDFDFCTFRLTGGRDYGLPSPGTITLTQLPSGDFNVYSFFDLTYQLEFEGCPDGQISDYMGTTTGTLRMETGNECGNSVVETGEQCDDGNTESCDGCSHACRTEVDSDGDAAVDACDNCPNVPNGPLAGPNDQLDADSNGIGDACQCGDCNGDGFTNITDALRIARGLVGAGSEAERLGDVNNDGVCNITDALIIARGLQGSAHEDQHCPAYWGQ